MLVASIDWTGVAAPSERIAPLDADTFVSRLNLLSARANDIRALRRAFIEQQDKARDERLSGNPESST